MRKRAPVVDAVRRMYRITIDNPNERAHRFDNLAIGDWFIDARNEKWIKTGIDSSCRVDGSYSGFFAIDHFVRRIAADGSATKKDKEG